MTAAPETLVRVQGDSPMPLAERYLFDLKLVQESLEDPAPVASQARGQDYTGLDEGRGPNPGERSGKRLGDQDVALRLAEDDRENGGAVEDQWPSGSKPRISSTSSLSGALPS